MAVQSLSSDPFLSSTTSRLSLAGLLLARADRASGLSLQAVRLKIAIADAGPLSITNERLLVR